MENNPHTISAKSLQALLNALSEAQFTMQAVAQALNASADSIISIVKDVAKNTGLNVEFIDLCSKEQQKEHL